MQADKKLDLWFLPELLVVHLKRFSYSRYSRNKLETHVDFPLTGLDLSAHVLVPPGPDDPAPVYDLFAVSNHFGSLGGGHYTAFAKVPGPAGGPAQWYCFDDSHVSPVADEADVKTSAAYVLFYRRRDTLAADPADLLQQLVAQQQVAEEAAAAEAAQHPPEEEAGGSDAKGCFTGEDGAEEFGGLEDAASCDRIKSDSVLLLPYHPSTPDHVGAGPSSPVGCGGGGGLEEDDLLDGVMEADMDIMKTVNSDADISDAGCERGRSDAASDATERLSVCNDEGDTGMELMSTSL